MNCPYNVYFCVSPNIVVLGPCEVEDPTPEEVDAIATLPALFCILKNVSSYL